MNTTTKIIAGQYRTADGKAQIEWHLEPKEHGPEFSASGEYDGGAGQNIDTIAAAYPDDQAVQRIASVWREWHLNGLNAGTPEQMAFLRANESKIDRGDYYGSACALLKAAGLYEVQIEPGTLQATGGFLNRSDPHTHKLLYRYGERWIYRPLPADVIAEIESWSSFGKNDGRSLGDVKAEKFLADHGLTFRATLSDSKPAQWEPSGHHYRVTITGKGRPRLVFDFWGSVADMQAGKHKIDACSVLSCVASDIHTPDNFEEFCSEYGYDADSIKARQTFTRSNRFARRLRAFFTAEEIKALRELR